jgi:hypothetical protein
MMAARGCWCVCLVRIEPLGDRGLGLLQNPELRLQSSPGVF